MREWLIKMRKARNMTQEDVATLCGISRQFYCFIENGDRTPSVETAKSIAAVLGFDWTLFYRDEDELMKTGTEGR